MFTVYILYSISASKTYVGQTANVEKRLEEHNFTSTIGFTKSYRPWVIIYTEISETRAQAMLKEKFYKTGKGRLKVAEILKVYLQNPI